MITFYTISVLTAIFLQAFFTASEMAFTSVDRIKLHSMAEAGSKSATKLESFLKNEGDYLGVTLVGTNVSVVVASVFATRIFMEYFDVGISPLLTTVVMVPITLVLAEIIPKMVARQFSMALALHVFVPLAGFSKIFYPVIVAVNFIARTVLAPFGKLKKSWDVKLTKNDLKKILLLGHETGEVEADEVEMIHKVLDFGSKKIGNIMVPMYRVSSINSDDVVKDLKELVLLTGYSRIPVYQKNKNNIIGIINIYDIIFEKSDAADDAGISEYIREIVPINQDDGLNAALTRLRRKKQPMGIVFDSNEQVKGIVTIEDIFEEIVGEIEDIGGV